jgi:hypothetical protein
VLLITLATDGVESVLEPVFPFAEEIGGCGGSKGTRNSQQIGLKRGGQLGREGLGLRFLFSGQGVGLHRASR